MNVIKFRIFKYDVYVRYNRMLVRRVIKWVVVVV